MNTVLKFGGSSLAKPDIIKNVIQIVADERAKGAVGIVVSAFGGITDHLITTARAASMQDNAYKAHLQTIKRRHRNAWNQLVPKSLKSRHTGYLRQMEDELSDLLHGIYLLKELSPRTLDLVMSFGERFSAFIITHALTSAGIPAVYCDTRMTIKTDNRFGNARVDLKTSYANLRKHVRELDALPVFTGFIASTVIGETTTLGRGGSDYTASIIAAALAVDELQIWTDVDGVMTADPRKVKKAYPLKSISYEEAMEMSHFGAKVIYPPTLQPAIDKKIRVRIKNTFKPAFEGTEIINKPANDEGLIVKGISSIDEIALLRVEGSGMVGVKGTAGRLFSALAEAGVNIILITQGSSEHSICLAVKPQEAQTAKQMIEEAFQLEIKAHLIRPVTIEYDCSVIAAIGEKMRNTPGIAGRLFQALAKNGINVMAIAQGSSELNISVVIQSSDLVKALNTIHDAFFLSGIKTIHLFIAGTGLIGKTLLRQLKNQLHSLKSDGIEMALSGLTNSRKMLIDEEGIGFSNWENHLTTKGENADLSRFIEAMIQLNLSNTIFVDCTASREVAGEYEKILNASISIVTPNKIANSGAYTVYKNLKETAARKNVKFFYETTVGAGLPVISTLQDLRNSGDRIVKIEGVLSGTLSYIFNVFDGSKTFSTVVEEARQKGYTEPDPRDDLNGRDIARKILILARESGFPAEPEDVEIENLIPLECREVKTVEEFFSCLNRFDDYFEQKRHEASRKNKKLRYIASFERNRLQVKLKAVDANSPFYHLTGSDNMIVFTTERYKDPPLVIKGPGAGAEVTAAGVFADIIKTCNYLS